MKKLPFDIVLLRLGLSYAQLRASESDVVHLFEQSSAAGNANDVNKKTFSLKSKADCSLYHNLTILHAKPELAQVYLGFCNLSHETLEVTDEGKIINIRTSENMDDTVQNILTNEKSGLTHLDLMSTVVPFTIADATCDLSYHRNQMDENIQAFGQSGADNVENFKNKWLSEYHQLGEPAYKLLDPFMTNLPYNTVTLGFECIMKNREGKGIDVVFVTPDKKIKKIDVTREQKISK